MITDQIKARDREALREEHPILDNNRLIVVSETRRDFDLAMELAFRHHPRSGCVGWSIYEPKRANDKWDLDRPESLLGVCGKKFIVLHWYIGETDKHVTPFPMRIDHKLAADFAWGWLQQQDFGQQPDHDGDNGEGFIVFNEPWGHVGGNHSAIIAVGPAWAMKGK